MQEILSFQTTPYFSFGPQCKSSLIAEFCRQNKFDHIKNPIVEAVQCPFDKNTIIEGSLNLFKELQLSKPELQVIFVGNQFSQEELQIKRDYAAIGKCIHVQSLKYEDFRRSLFPNLIMFYGPDDKQNKAAAQSFASVAHYCQVYLPSNPNILIKQFKKTVNYTIAGCFTNSEDLQILQQYFNLKIVHFKYNRIDISGKSQFFDKQFQLIPFLRSKLYYVPVNGSETPVQIMDNIGIGVCPQLIFAKCDSKQKQEYLNTYVVKNQNDTLLLEINNIKKILNRKGIQVKNGVLESIKILNEIIYRNANIKTIIILGFPQALPDLDHFQNTNRKFSWFIDLTSLENYQYTENFGIQMKFLQNQKRIVPSLDTPLEEYLNTALKYWVVKGVQGSGKSTVAKYLNSQFGLTLIQFEQYIGPVKEKLANPDDDGEDVPLKKILDHFFDLFSLNRQTTYVIDGLPYQGKDLQQWIDIVGAPSVINLSVEEVESIKRLRKKQEADVNAEITQEDTQKAKANFQKHAKWIQTLKQCSPTANIHEIDFNKPILLSEKQIDKIFKKNVYLVQVHNSLAFLNIAQKYQYGFINLGVNELRTCDKVARKLTNKDLIICYYKQGGQKMISQDLYWIQQNIGNIQYIGVWVLEDTQAQDQKFMLEKPVVQQKPKVQGEQGEQKPPEQQEQKQVKKFDKYAYEWTRPKFPRNLSQWYLSSKKNVNKIQSERGGQNILKQWQKIRNYLNKSQNVYQVFK